MADYNIVASGDLAAQLSTDGTIVPFLQANLGCTLGAHTYYFALGTELAPMPSQAVDLSIGLEWAALVAGVFTVEVCNFPLHVNGVGQGAIDVADWSTKAGDWVQYNPALTGSIYANAVGTGNSVSALTITAGGTNAGGAIINIPDVGFRRVRIKAVLSVGGVVRVSRHGKLGA